jgi:hypothetical protein
MAQSIILKRSALQGKVPTTSSLSLGELAVNTYDGKIYLNRSGSIQSIQEIVTTNVVNTGSITLTKTGSFGELVVSQDGNFQRDLYVTRDIITNGNLDILYDITASVVSASSFIGYGAGITGVTASMRPDDFDFNSNPFAGTTGYIQGTGSLYKVATINSGIEFRYNDIVRAKYDTTNGFSSSIFGIGDVVAFSSSLATTNASVNSSITNINLFTASNANTSLNLFTSSAALRLTNLETTSASVNSSITNLNAFTSSTAALGSLNQFTASINGWSGSYATTGSNSFIGNQTISGSLTIGSASVSTENTLLVGPSPAGGVGEGGQILLAASGGLYTSASMIDNYQNQFRILRGSNAGSDGQHLAIDLHIGKITLNKYTGSGAFPGTAAGYLAVDTAGNVITTTPSTTDLTQLNAFTASSAIRLTNLETTSASVNISVSNLNTYSASVSNSIGNINAFTSSQNTIESGQNARLTNLETTSASVNISVSNLNTSTSSFETKGRGIISGSSQLSGTTITDLTIVNLTTINETASVIFSSGSNRFGDFGNDIHQFTGSVQISGSQTITGSLTIGGDILPSANATYNIGANAQRFNSVYVTNGFTTTNFGIVNSNGALTLGASNATMGQFSGTTGNLILQKAGTFSDNGARLQINSTGSQGALYVSGSTTMTGSLIVTNGITGSLFGTASFALNGSSNAFLYQTASAASIWTFNHYLQTRYPVIAVYDNTDSIIIPQSITAVDDNTTTITFSSARTGTAVASKGGYVGSVVTSATTATSATSASVAVTASYAISASAAANTFGIGASSTTYGSYINTIQGANTIISTPTGSYSGAFYKYVATSGSNARAGEVMAIWNNTTTQFTDVTTNDIGSTTMVTSSVALSAGSAVLSFTTNTNGWNIKTFVTYL